MLITALFTAATLFALGTIVVTLQQYGRAAVALRGELLAGAPVRSFSYRIVGARRSAEVVALPVRARGAKPAAAPAELLAAA